MAEGPETELARCPFCGGKAELENTICEALVRCSDCYATLVRGHSAKKDTGIKKVIEAWNIRTGANQQMLERSMCEALGMDYDQERRLAELGHAPSQSYLSEWRTYAAALSKTPT